MKVVILAYIPRAEELTARIAWSSISALPPAEHSGEKSVEKLFKLARKMKLSSVLDFPYYIVSFEGVSRVFTHQWVRYRIAAHVQQSLRYVKIDAKLRPEDPWFVIPPSLVKAGIDAIVGYIKTTVEAGREYLRLVESGVPPEDARFVLPMSVKTHITSAMDAEELLHVIEQRTCFDAQWEIRTAAYALLAGLVAVSPTIFREAGPYCVYEGVCRGRGKGLCRGEASALCKRMVEVGLSVAEKLRKVDSGHFVEVDLTEILGYRAPPELGEEVSRRLGLEGPIKLDYEVGLKVFKV